MNLERAREEYCLHEEATVCVPVEGQLVALAAWLMQLQGSCGIVWMAPLAVTSCAWSRVSEQGGPCLVPVLLLAIFGPGDHHRAGRGEGENTSHFQCVTPLSSHRKVSKSVFTLSLAYIFVCISSEGHPTQNQLFLGQHDPAFSGSLSGNGVTIHVWVIVVGKQLHPHKSLVITTFSYWQAI